MYPIFFIGWSSNCKYSIIGGLRSVAQIVSYEISLGVVLISFIWVSGGFSLKDLGLDIEKYRFFVYSPLIFIWFLCLLAETNRRPYDFSEGESELVSGFNTEYGSAGFTCIFISEYVRLLFIRYFFCLIFFRYGYYFNIFLKRGFVCLFIIWVRGRTPRYRYDKLMGLAWKSLLPGGLFLLWYYFILSY